MGCAAKTWDITLKYESILVLIMLDADDPQFVRVVQANFWAFEPYHLDAALSAADMANKTVKGAKIYLDQNCGDTFASVDFLNNDGGMSGDLLVRYITMVTHGAKTYLQAFNNHISGASL